MDVRYHMMYDHQKTDDLISSIVSSVGKPDMDIISNIVTMLKNHIYLEETLLFPMLPKELEDEVEYLEKEHVEIFRILVKIEKDDNDQRIRGLFSDLLGLLIEHNSYEESFIYDSYESLESGMLEKVPARPRDWKCRMQ